MGSKAVQYFLGNLQLGEFVLLGLELIDQVEHAPWVGGVNGDALEHLGQQQVACLFVGALEN